MKTIDGFCIKELRLRNWRELWGSTTEYNKRIGVVVSSDLHKKLTKISECVGVTMAELIRALLNEFVNEISIEEINYEENKQS